MDFTLNEQQTELQRVARDFAQKKWSQLHWKWKRRIFLYQNIG